MRPLLIVNSDGATSRVAKTRAIDTYDSGPSAGVLGASFVAARSGPEHVCTFDVGGTTSDVAFLIGAEVPADELTDVGDAAIPHPAVSLTSFGIGGGSIISVDRRERSASARRAPARSRARSALAWAGSRSPRPMSGCCSAPLQPGEFLGGRRRLDVVPARRPQPSSPGNWWTTEDARSEPKPRFDGSCPSTCSAGRRATPYLTRRRVRSLAVLVRRRRRAVVRRGRRHPGHPHVVVFPHSSVFSAFGAGSSRSPTPTKR